MASSILGPTAPIPIDPARVPTLTEVVDLQPGSPEPMPSVGRPQQNSAPLDSQASNVVQRPKSEAGPQVEPSSAPGAPPDSGAAGRNAGGVGPDRSVASAASAGSRTASLPPWAYKIVAEAIDEAIAQAMPQLMADITKHVQRRLLEAARSHPDRLI
jgi:hypothetical protein